MNQIKALLTLRKKTNNWLHLILTLCSFGVWAWVWLYLMVNAQKHNADIDRQISDAIETQNQIDLAVAKSRA